MKKILAILTALIFALFNNLEPIPSERSSFTPDSYYVGNIHNEVDYQQLYSSHIDNVSVAGDDCNTTPVDAPDWKSVMDKTTYGRIWVVYQSKPIDSDEVKSAVKLGCRNGQVLIAPFSGVISTSSAKSKNGTVMTFTDTGGTNRISLTNMSRWYCCRRRKPVDDWTATFTHTKDAENQKLSQGAILGYATEDTELLIEHKVGLSWETVSVNEFFK